MEQHVVDASSINSFMSHLQKIRETIKDGFFMDPAKPYEPHLWIDCS